MWKLTAILQSYFLRDIELKFTVSLFDKKNDYFIKSIADNSTQNNFKTNGLKSRKSIIEYLSLETKSFYIHR